MILSNTEWRESQKLITEERIKILLQWVDTISYIFKLEDELIMFYNGNWFGRTGFGYA